MNFISFANELTKIAFFGRDLMEALPKAFPRFPGSTTQEGLGLLERRLGTKAPNYVASMKKAVGTVDIPIVRPTALTTSMGAPKNRFSLGNFKNAVLNNAAARAGEGHSAGLWSAGPWEKRLYLPDAPSPDIIAHELGHFEQKLPWLKNRFSYMRSPTYTLGVEADASRKAMARMGTVSPELSSAYSSYLSAAGKSPAVTQLEPDMLRRYNEAYWRSASPANRLRVNRSIAGKSVPISGGRVPAPDDNLVTNHRLWENMDPALQRRINEAHLQELIGVRQAFGPEAENALTQKLRSMGAYRPYSTPVAKAPLPPEGMWR